MVSIITPQQLSYAHLYGDRTQEWINTKDDIKIQFTYQPEKPIIDAFTELKFSVQNLTRGSMLSDQQLTLILESDEKE